MGNGYFFSSTYVLLLLPIRIALYDSCYCAAGKPGDGDFEPAAGADCGAKGEALLVAGEDCGAKGDAVAGAPGAAPGLG